MKPSKTFMELDPIPKVFYIFVFSKFFEKFKKQIVKVIDLF